MQESVGPVFARLARQRQGFVDPGQGSFRALPFGFNLGKQASDQRPIKLGSLLRKGRQPRTHVRERSRAIAEPRACPAPVRRSERAVHRHAMLLAELAKCFRVS